jgi:phosphoribosyl-AMP cyclohydrolase
MRASLSIVGLLASKSPVCSAKNRLSSRRWLVCNAARAMSFFDKLKYTEDGLIPAIVQEAGTGRVLMMAWMNRASLESTIKTGKTHFWSRSRKKFWMKGEESGHTQTVKDIAFDCDGDTLLIQVDQSGAACHEGFKSCFFRSVEGDGANFKITEPQLLKPDEIYKKPKG